MLNVERAAGGGPIQRNLFRLLFVAVAGILAPVTIAVAGIAYLWTPDASVSRVSAGPVEDYNLLDMVLFEEGEFFLTRLPDRFLAINQRSTHMRCKVSWNAQSRQFISPCDGSVFDDKGEVVRGPAPRPLGTHAITVENGELIIEVGDENVRKRDRYDPGQGAEIG